MKDKGYIESSQASHPIYNLQFGLMCTSSFLFSASFNMLIPELPEYLTGLGGAEYKGLIIALFTLTAGISRPFSGRLTDTFGRIPVMAIGSLVCFVCGILYPMLTTVAGFLFLRLIHGFSTGFKPTATSAYVADIVPQQKWGEALGIHGICFSTGMAIGPALGSMIRNHFSMDMLFYVSSIFALLSIAILMNMKETLVKRQPFSFKLFKLTKNDIIAKEAIPAAVVTLLSYVSYGVVLTLIPDWTKHVGIQNKGIFFVVFTIFSILVRFFAGKASDKHGRISVIKIGLSLLTISLVVIAWFDDISGLIAGAALYGIATGILSPAVNAWTADLSNPNERGKAMATMYIALEIGIGSGALIAGWFYHDVINKVPVVLYFSSIVTIVALFFMFARERTKA
jgi:MFS family permease